jgi:DNA topoisomerase-3
MILVICEKPDAAKQIAEFLEKTQSRQGYLEGSKYLITWAVGHLIELAKPEEYTGNRKWDLKDLPILPDDFILKPDPAKTAQIKVIKQLVQRSDIFSVVNCCDPDREGELIFRYIWKYIQGSKQVDRVWLNTFTKADVQKAFSNTEPQANYHSLAFAGKGRSEADWLLGMNSTMALSLAVNRGTLSLGRVQTATLALICKRTLEHRDFVPKPFWVIELQSEKDGVIFTGETTNFWDKVEANEALLRANRGTKKVSEKELEKRVERPPLLYDLTALQQKANQLYGFTAAQTDKIAQELYQAGLMSYPRTDSRFIGENLFQQIPDRIRSVGKIFPFSKYQAGYPFPLSKHCVDDSKVTGHHALLPTAELSQKSWDALVDGQKKILGLVIVRMYQAFEKDCIKELTGLTILSGDVEFYVHGTKVIQPGWRRIYSDREDDNESEQKIPSLKVSDTLQGDISLYEGKTNPPALFSERSLIAAMKNCAVDMDDKALKNSLENVEGIGRPATRSSIIETLLSRKYCIRDKEKIIPTELGFGVYNLVKDFKIANPILTAEWELKLDEIANNKRSYTGFIKECKEYTSEIVREILSLKNETENLNQVSRDQEILGMVGCPKCGKKTVKTFVYQRDGKTITAIGCRDKECKFAYFNPEICGKRLTEKQLYDLVQKGITGLIKGFVNKKTGKGFDRKVRLKDDYQNIEFV